jgi:hypothetical protein
MIDPHASYYLRCCAVSLKGTQISGHCGQKKFKINFAQVG